MREAMFDPEKFGVVVGGVPALALAEGDDVIVFEFNTPQYTTQVGVHGTGGFVRSADRSGKLTVKLQGWSPTKAHWNAISKAGVPVPVMVFDRNNDGEVAGSTAAMLEQTPNLSKGASVGDVEYTFIFVKGYCEHMGQQETLS
ncbi:hypothetical protein vBYenM636_65 [Yersinia phage vB_YenM_636]|nr:hypothetical protein X1_81 [Yersinia phage vB_Yen_X1]QKN86316.1 hypothetical protein vBYenM12_65 [Yersinia phage vB_YenM_12]QKN86407.1 hypothetical protein vBYenM22_65 [Yersinia phage vB_YenM_22]QKN86498.1 hypothetical protein vBYenM25_65 [Yersinia phage vB_YenM_25]QKN86589.1 hypothetical protein vBYenM27_65 [Yersinia phage vB_YenM_27]QKN86680.1 hypothetical protein vBYenM39_65 [Yersinia phage vB_YenM_39]QKN86771.1 hypothetical protein vBYenM126_65 [Yersinia phage vB_YenM_126]QKN86862.1 h